MDRVRAANPRAHLCAYGLYAPLEREAAAAAGMRKRHGRRIRTAAAGPGARWRDARGERHRQPTARSPWPASSSCVPDRTGLPPLGAYAQLRIGGATRRVGYTEAVARLQAPVPPLPGGAGLPRPVPHRAGAMWCSKISAARWPPGAQHITFGDPDFFNGPGPCRAHRRGAARASGRSSPTTSPSRWSTCCSHRDLLPVLQSHRLPVRDQRGGIVRRRRARKAGQGPHAAPISWKRSS